MRRVKYLAMPTACAHTALAKRNMVDSSSSSFVYGLLGGGNDDVDCVRAEKTRNSHPLSLSFFGAVISPSISGMRLIKQRFFFFFFFFAMLVHPAAGSELSLEAEAEVEVEVHVREEMVAWMEKVMHSLCETAFGWALTVLDNNAQHCHHNTHGMEAHTFRFPQRGCAKGQIRSQLRPAWTCAQGQYRVNPRGLCLRSLLNMVADSCCRHASAPSVPVCLCIGAWCFRESVTAEVLWSRRLMRLLADRHRSFHLMNWFSTMGGGYSQLAQQRHNQRTVLRARQAGTYALKMMKVRLWHVLARCV